MRHPTVSAAVFAYNEEASITACLDALRDCAREGDLTVHVLINGCTDRTEEIVRAYEPRGFHVVPVIIAMGDKANAWNIYTHLVAPAQADFHVFTDGDMQICPGSILGFAERFQAEPEAWGCAALPVSGRSRKAFSEQILRERSMAGNLYALRRDTLLAFRDRGVKLPRGIFGEDGLVATLVKHGLDTKGPSRPERIAISQTGGFGFSALSLWKAQDWRTYRNRKRRYALRRLQAEMLYSVLYAAGMQAMPEHVIDLYRSRFKTTRLKFRGLDTIFDWEARRRVLRDLARADDVVKAEDQAHLYS